MVTGYVLEDNTIITKTCSKGTEHHVVWFATTQNHKVFKVRLRLITESPKQWMTWVFTKQRLFITTAADPDKGHSSKFRHLPFFQPDLTNCQKLMTKVHLYLTFS